MTVSSRVTAVCLEVGLSKPAARAVALLVTGYLRKEKRHRTIRPEFQNMKFEQIAENGFDWDAPAHLWSWRTANEVLAALGRPAPTTGDCMIFSATMERLGATQRKRSNGKNLRFIPPFA